jgi:phosphate transport system substrate-binding protein
MSAALLCGVLAVAVSACGGDDSSSGSSGSSSSDGSSVSGTLNGAGSTFAAPI